MKKIAALFFIFAFASPAFALADAASDAQVQIQHIAVAAAALEAQILSIQTGQPLACAVFVSKSLVKVGEPLVLAWGAVGAVDKSNDPTSGELAPNGVTPVALEKAGTWKYTFTFSSASGATTSCAATIRVSA